MVAPEALDCECMPGIKASVVSADIEFYSNPNSPNYVNLEALL